MAYDLTILAMAKSLARHAATRQNLVAENIANADTVGYRARALESFAAAYDGPRGDLAPGAGAQGAARPAAFSPLATRPGHAGFEPAEAPDHVAGARIYDVSAIGADSPNGNSVSVEDQMARGAGAMVDHEMALGVLRKSLDMLRLAVTKPR